MTQAHVSLILIVAFAFVRASCVSVCGADKPQDVLIKATNDNVMILFIFIISLLRIYFHKNRIEYRYYN